MGGTVTGTRAEMSEEAHDTFSLPEISRRGWSNFGAVGESGAEGETHVK